MFALKSEEEAGFMRQRRAREGGRERQVKESACEKALRQASARAIWRTEGRRMWLGEWNEMRVKGQQGPDYAGDLGLCSSNK